MADGRYISAVDTPILIKFGRIAEIWSLKPAGAYRPLRILIFENPRWRLPLF